MPIILIACVDINNGIGNAKNDLLFKLPNDLKRFKEITTNKNVVFGRKTWESLPVRPLPKRKSHVLTSDEDYQAEGRTKVLHEIGEILEMGKKKDVYVCGGGNLYHQLIEYADTLLLTHVHVIDDSAKVYFPEVDVREWRLMKIEKHEADEKHPYSYTFAHYKRQISKQEKEEMILKELLEKQKDSEEQQN